MIPALWTSPPLTAEESARWATSEERAAAAGFVSERRRAEFLTWRAVVRRELGDDVGIAYDALGAPVLTNRAVHISVAHCAGRIAVCASPERCAVDIEPATRDFRRAASRYLTPEEEALSDDPLLPGIVWCAKETLYKYAGRRELDFRRDLHVVRLDLAAGTLAGRIGNGEPVRLSVSLDEGFILVYIL